MGVAGSADNFYTPSICIGNMLYCAFDFVVKTRPAALRIEFVIGII